MLEGEMLQPWTDTRSAKGLAAGLAAAIFVTELLHDAALPEHSPHGEPTSSDPSRQTIAGAGSIEGRPITFVGTGPIQFVGRGGHPLTFVANGRPSELDGLDLDGV